MERDGLAEDVGRPVARIVVLERSHAGEHGAQRAESDARSPGIFVVATAHGESEAVSGGRHDRGWPDLDVQLVHLPGRERLLLVVGVIRPVGLRELGVELAMRGPQPSLGDRRVRIERALKRHLAHVRREEPNDEEQVGVDSLGRHVELGGERSRDLGLALEWRREERQAVPEAGVARPAGAGQRRAGEALPAGIQLEPRPLGARPRPFALGALDEAPARMTNLEQPRRSEEHTSELQSLAYLVCRLLLEKKKKTTY